MVETPRSPRWMRVLLVVSLAANLLVLGAAVGMVLRGPPPAARSLLDGAASPLLGAMGEDRRALIVGEMRERSPRFRENRSELRAAFGAVLAELRSERFDPEALGAALARQDAALQQRQAIGRDVLLSQIAEMSPDERRAFADRLEETVRRGRFRHSER